LGCIKSGSKWKVLAIQAYLKKQKKSEKTQVCTANLSMTNTSFQISGFQKDELLRVMAGESGM